MVVGGDLAQRAVTAPSGGVVGRVVARLGCQQAQPRHRTRQPVVLLAAGASGQLGRLQPVRWAGLSASGASGGLDLADEVLPAAGDLGEHEGQLVLSPIPFDRDPLTALGDWPLGLRQVTTAMTRALARVGARRGGGGLGGYQGDLHAAVELTVAVGVVGSSRAALPLTVSGHREGRHVGQPPQPVGDGRRPTLRQVQVVGVIGDVIGVPHDRDLATGIGGQLLGRLIQRGVRLGAQVGRVRGEQHVGGQVDDHRLARHPRVRGPVHRGGEGLQRHRIRTALGVVDVLQRFLGLIGQLAVAHHRHALEQAGLGHQDVDGFGTDRLEQGVQRGVGLLLRQPSALGRGLEGLLHRIGVEVHQAHTISTSEVSRTAPGQMHVELLAVR